MLFEIPFNYHQKSYLNYRSLPPFPLQTSNGLISSFMVQFSLQDSVQDLRQVVLDRPESCYRTSFSLQVDGARLDDFAELHMIEGLKEGVTIKVVEGKQNQMYG